MPLIDDLPPVAGPAPKQRKVNGQAYRPTGDSLIDTANAQPIRDVLAHLGCLQGKRITCPGHGEAHKDSSVAIVRNGVKCMHDRCADRGQSGFFNVVDAVIAKRGGTPIEAAKWILERQGVPLPERPRVNGSGKSASHEPPPDFDDDPSLREHPDANPDAPPAPVETPTADDPLRGLKHLRPIATMGRARLLELAAQSATFVWQDIAVAGTIVLIAGPPAEGKTTLLFLILSARANTGRAIEFLGRRIEPAPKGSWIVLIEGEHSDASAARKLIRSMQLLGIDDSALERVIIIARKAVTLGSPAWQDVVRLVGAGLVSDIAIDTVARVAPADADNEREQVQIFDLVAQAIDAAPSPETQPMAWAIAHTRKSMTGGLADVAGSAQRTGQADSVLLIRGEKVDGRTVATKVTFEKLREDPEEYPAPVSFAIVADDRGARIETSCLANVDGRPLETRILELLKVGPKSKNALSEALARSRKDVDEALSHLFSSRSIETVKVPAGNRKVKGFQLRESDATESGLRTSGWSRRMQPDEQPDEPGRDSEDDGESL